MVVVQEKKLKSSRQRDLILRIIRSTHCHPTADWIYEKARKSIPNISLGTVYRNLNLLRDGGKIQELHIGKGISRYDGDLRDHYHVRCMVCGKIEDVPHISPRISSEAIEELTGYHIHNYCLEFRGVCSDCNHNKQF
jgi:Fur family peroxide stress response transcriptional regulator